VSKLFLSVIKSRLGTYRLVAVMATALLFDFAAALAFVVLMN
jgi:hypothetical protein